MSDSPSHESIAALQALGSALRQGREGQGLGVAELAQRLKMGEEQLQALEAGDASRLPEPVFVIAQARRVASTLAINVDVPLQVLRDSGQFWSKPMNVAELAPRKQETRAAQSGALLQGALQTLAGLALAAGVVAAVAAGAPVGLQQWQRFQASRQAQPTAPTRAAAASPQANTPQTATPQTTPQLLLRTSQPSWLEVKQAGGKSLFRGTFKGEQRFPLGGGLQVLAGRPDLVEAQLGSGPAKPLGRIDQVRWQVFKAPAP